MFQKINTDSIESKYIKSLLSNTCIPNYKCVSRGDYVIKDCLYIYKQHVIRCTYSGPLLDNYAYVTEYHPNEYNPQFTEKYFSDCSYYDGDTHRYLGEYLRMYRGYTDIDLMPFYNCFYSKYTDKFRLVHKKDYNKSISYIEESDDFTKVAMIPIKFDKTYTIALDCDSDVLMKAFLMDEFGLLKHRDPITNEIVVETDSLANCKVEYTEGYSRSSFKKLSKQSTVPSIKNTRYVVSSFIRSDNISDDILCNVIDYTKFFSKYKELTSNTEYISFDIVFNGTNWEYNSIIVTLNELGVYITDGTQFLENDKIHFSTLYFSPQYYKKIEDTDGTRYIPIVNKPSDWDTNYYNYYSVDFNNQDSIVTNNVETVCLQKTAFLKPVTYKITLDTNDLTDFKKKEIYKLEKYLYLCIQMPVKNKSSLVVLEGNYTSNVNEIVYSFDCMGKLEEDIINNQHKNFTNFLKSNIVDVKDLGNYELKKRIKFAVNTLYGLPIWKRNQYMISKLSLLMFNSLLQYVYSDRLVEYLLGNVITSDDDISRNILAVKEKLGYVDYTSEWTLELQYELYQKFLTSGYKYSCDVNGFVDKTIETIIHL